MKTIVIPLAIAGFPALATAQGALVGTEGIDDRIDDIRTDVTEDIDEGNDPDRFGPRGFSQGWGGSVALGLSATSGNTDTADLSVGARLTYGSGPNFWLFGLGAEISEDNNVRNKEEIFGTLEYNRYFSDRFYVFGLGTFEYDDFASNKWDAFLGAGPGYVILNDSQVRWRVQAGIGGRFIEDQNDLDETEVAGIASSRFYYEINETMYLTNDTDFLFSDDSFVATNDLGVNFRMTNTLSTRVSLYTDYDDDPLPGLDSTDNTLKVSLVAGF